ncbi:MAG TPA: tRNA (adenosine(37)-N6)-threonylcarbamoyltransferase complex transferase subunit TsaD, partial [Firmicutes bacterium]|nr:tRNA (adenosine(37)-N6)-threonylcarbamoyltransferase complex transferase subunit TsaD [Bacillota bacterium]
MAERRCILAIESSCDETAAAVLDGDELKSNIISTQIKEHQKYGGVYPELASRLHLQNVASVIFMALDKAGVKPEELTHIAVTAGPGLPGALQVGVIAAKTLAAFLNIPIIGVHHLAGHLYANEYAGEFHFPLVACLASGGNSEIILMRKHLDFSIVGQTLDDAIGEAFDKVAREIGLPYPGGVYIDRLVKSHP